MDQLRDLYFCELKRMAKELKIKGRSKMSRIDLINELKKI